ncbi:AEC family transporter [Roseibium polysiphoniae]|uniref:AEC family transporter n=1 Tax=Roseibium polysiphoniae TaxID=2571221 RepID=A0ABR9C6J3_9HYPH|nr:AEC family transporter [Roseibium polysiphoniae]MBD8875517.1 AEC family transporter [Roseibium polysiphoniae]
MLMTLAALLPIILITALGYALERTNIISRDQWSGIERLAYFLLFPAILFQSIALADFGRLPTLSMGLSLLCAISVMMLLVLALRPFLQARFAINGPRFTSIFQGSVRWNGFLALAMADSLIGAEGVALLAIAMVVMIPVLNIASILVLSRYGDSGEAPTVAKVARDLYTNPFNIAIAAGIFFNVLAIPIPSIAQTTLTMLGAAALPVGIICVGASLDLNSLRRPGPALSSGTFIRLLISPLVGAGFAALFGVTGSAHIAILIACSVPSASNSFLLARLMGGDAKLMAEILTLQTLAAMVTIPVALALLG